VVNRRHAALEILLYPALVQGDAASSEVAKGIAHFNETREVDLIVIARGGGSLEDLAPFNTESLARAIAASELPIVSAIGHETDFTIADFAADLRAPTPSAAAELITAAQHRVEEHVEELSQRLHRAARYAVMQARERFSRVSMDTAFARIEDGLHRRQQRVDELGFRMESAWRALSQKKAQRLQSCAAAMLRNDAAQRIALMRERLDNLSTRLTRTRTSLIQGHRASLQSLERQLASLSPLAVLNRGYALVYDETGALLKDAAGVTPGQILSTRLASGNLESRVTKINSGPEQA
ncbi:MAG: exodeoxyribonuclease VII large subunit, partial [Acidobacteriaceae bacterium]